MRNTLNILQGSDKWLAVRANYFTASEAPAAAGKSKYTTRDDLLKLKHTGIAPDVDSSKQALFDKGHAAEASARPIAEALIDEELSPVTMTFEVDDLKLLASLDGINFDGTIIFEHKLWSNSLAQSVRDNDLPENYTLQLDQQLLVSGAEKCLFMVSDGTEANMVYCWYESNQTKQLALIIMWQQFKEDLKTYVLPVQIEKVEADQIQTLPVPSVIVRGEITASNLTEITPKFDAYLSSVKTELSNDQDFADAEANAKNCRETAKRIVALRENIIAQMITVNEVSSILVNYEEAFNKLGLRLEKAVKEQKESIKLNAVLEARNEYSEFVKLLEKDLPVTLHHKLVAPDFVAAIKGIRTIESMQSRINDCLAQAKTDATTLASDVKHKVAYIQEAIKGYEHLIKLELLAFSDLDYIKLYIENVKSDEDKRKAEHEARIKAQAEADIKARFEHEAELKAFAAQRQAEEVQRAIELEQKKEASITEEKLDHIANAGKQIPSAYEIINAVAIFFKIDEMLAHKYLIETDFINIEFNKVA